jgi:integrase
MPQGVVWSERRDLNWSRSKARLDESLSLPEWTLHDLRRSMATRMADSPDDGGLGIQPHVIEAILNHVSGHKAGVAGIYNRSSYRTDKREALEAWGKHRAVIAAQANGGHVASMRGRK